jgi:hypothetical protein
MKPLVLALAAAALVLAPAAVGAKPKLAPPPPPGQFRVTGAVEKPLLLSVEQLAALPQVTMTVTFRNRNTPQTHTEQGPLLTDVLALAKPKIDAKLRNDQLRYSIEATATDGYAAVVSYGELDPNFGGKQVILSIVEDGSFLTAVGPRLIVPGDLRGGRDVSGVDWITLTQAPLQAPKPTS